MDSIQQEAIIEYARKTIVQMGVKALRMDDIAQATRTSKRTLYETFKDKEELLFLAVREHFDAFDRRNGDMAKNAPNILIAILIVIEQVRKNSELNWSIVTSLKRFYPHIYHRVLNDKADLKKKFIRKALNLGIKQGYIEKRINPELTMSVLNYIAMGISENNEAFDIPDGISVNNVFWDVLITYIRGVCTPKGVQIIDGYLETNKKLK
ncbi:MAG: TetR/AcrR family transcriptional regulator [Rikenellaceae bacterium]